MKAESENALSMTKAVRIKKHTCTAHVVSITGKWFNNNNNNNTYTHTHKKSLIIYKAAPVNTLFHHNLEGKLCVELWWPVSVSPF